MNFKIYTTGLMVVFLGFLTACNIDDIKPVKQLTKKDVITNEASAQLVLNRIYNRTRAMGLNYFTPTLGYYGLEKTRRAGLQGDAGFAVNNVQDDSEILQQFYISAYAIISEANFFIELVEGGAAKETSDVRKKEMLSEAKTLRALSHFRLLIAFGQFYDKDSQYGIAVSMKPIKAAKDKLARTSVQDAYDKIIADLNYAVANGRTGLSNHYYVAKATAQALLAKVYLYQADFEKAASNALAVINNSDGYGLETRYGDVFRRRWTSREVLFAPFVDGNKEGSALTGFLYSGANFGPAASSPTFKQIADKSDGTVGDGVDSSEPGPGGPGVPVPKGYDKRYIWAFTINRVQSPNSNAKYPFMQTNRAGGAGNTYYYLRMAEVYLIYAEAEARRSGGSLDEAIKRLNEVRTRGGMAAKTKSDKATFLVDVREEKMLELFSENSESYYDLIRYHILGDLDVTRLKPSLRKDKFIFPIPVSARSGNNLLIQNPSY